jgi:hypothetical protein
MDTKMPAWEMPDGRNEAERRFLAECKALRCLPDVWIWPGRPLITAMYVIDRDDGNGVLRTLRADFDGETLRCGNDPTHQFVGDLDPDDPDSYVLGGRRSPEELAAAAVAWYKQQLARPVDRLEWDAPPARLWVLADVGRAISARWRRRSGPPDRVVRIHPR